MSSNTNTSRYKQVNRQARIQTREGAFSKGMMYTDKPLVEGYSKLLVNYDIDPLDGTLRTRKGLQATGVYPVLGMADSAKLFDMNNGFTNIVNSATRSLGRSTQNNTAKNSEIATDLVVYNTSTNALNVVALAGFTEEDRGRTEGNVNNTKRYLSKNIYSVQPLCSGKDDAYQVTPHSILEPGIHGQKCVHDLYFRKPVGTFAFGNAYYTFSKHTLESKEIKDELHYTQYYTDDERPLQNQAVHENEPVKVLTGSLYDYHVAPQILNPSEAASSGFNMLAENPYAFECENGANISILGVLPYNPINSELLLNVLTNQDILLKCFYRAPVVNKYYTFEKTGSAPSWSKTTTFYRSYTLDRVTGELTLANPVPHDEVEVGITYYRTLVSTGPMYEYTFKDKTVANDGTVTLTVSSSAEFTYTVVQKMAPIYHIKWEWREVGNAQWNLIQEDPAVSFETLALQPLECPFKAAVEQLILRITISDPNNKVPQSDGTEIEYVEATVSMGLTCYSTNTLLRQNVAPANYNLATAKGMLEWKNRLVLWGVENAETILFTSDINNPSYFPYPNNIDVLDEPVLHCMLYGDDLVVFTNTKLYRLTIGETGGIGMHTLVQKNLNIVEKDLPMFCVIKNLLFFKSGNYYYMLAPKSSSIVGETTIAPISNTIAPFLDNFNTEVEKLFKIYTQGKTVPDPDKGYEAPFTSYLEYYYAYADNESVVVNYVYDYSGFLKGTPDLAERGGTYTGYDADLHYWPTPDFTSEDNSEYVRPKDKRQFVLALIYNTSTYAWAIRIYEIPNIVHPVYNNVLGQQHYMYITVQDTTSYGKSPVFVQCTKQNTEDNLIVYQDGLIDNYVDYSTVKYWMPIQNNYQYLDTGYRMLTGAVDIKKRFREIQFSINNASQKALTFYTAFIVDGNLRKDMKGYTTKMMVDPDDPRTGVLLVERPYIDERYLPSVPDYVIKVEDYVSPDITPGDTTLDDTFVLDNTQFPDLAYWKVRVDVSGKGYVPRLQILSVNDKEYSLLSTNWVYRTMNSR